MSNFETIATVLGWCTVINACILGLVALLPISASDHIASIHSKLLNVDKEKLPALYFSYLANYKIAVLVFNLVPYLAFKLAV